MRVMGRRGPGAGCAHNHRTLKYGLFKGSFSSQEEYPVVFLCILVLTQCAHKHRKEKYGFLGRKGKLSHGPFLILSPIHN